MTQVLFRKINSLRRERYLCIVMYLSRILSDIVPSTDILNPRVEEVQSENKAGFSTLEACSGVAEPPLSLSFFLREAAKIPQTDEPPG